MIFQTDRLFARLWREEDLSSLVSIYTNPEVRKYLSPHQPSTPEAIEANLKGRLDDQKDWAVGYGAWALVRKEDERLIGAVFCGEFPNGDKEIAWHLGQEYWGYGYATEATRALKDYVFERLPDITKLRAVVVPENLDSKKVAKKVGMTSTGASDLDYGVMLEVFEIVR